MKYVNRFNGAPMTDFHAFSVTVIGLLALAAAGVGAVAWAMGGVP
jgi:hypothetical protein